MNNPKPTTEQYEIIELLNSITRLVNGDPARWERLGVTDTHGHAFATTARIYGETETLEALKAVSSCSS